jgi:hypothetical protein
MIKSTAVLYVTGKLRTISTSLQVLARLRHLRLHDENKFVGLLWGVLHLIEDRISGVESR